MRHIEILRRHSCKIVNLLDEVKASDGCVYAVDLSGVPKLEMGSAISISHHVSAPVPPTALIAKVIVPRETKLEDVFTPKKSQYDLSSIYEKIPKPR